MNILKSHKTAVAITAVAVAASAVLGCNRSLAAQRAAVAKTITAGADGSGYSVATDSQDLVNVARNLITVAKKYIPGEDILSDLEAYCGQMEEAGTDAGERKNAALGIRSCAESVQMLLADRADVSDGDRAYLAGFRSDLSATLDRMGRDPYNDLARQFNDEMLGKFPGSVLGFLVRPLETLSLD